MSKALERLKEMIRELTEEELEEMTGTGAVGGFATPFAFSTKKPVSSKDDDDDVNEAFEKLTEGGDPYYAWRNDETLTPKQKIGNAIAEINKQLAEMSKVVKRSARLKKEMGVPNGDLWKRTNVALMRMESRMHGIAQQIRNMRG